MDNNTLPAGELTAHHLGRWLEAGGDLIPLTAYTVTEGEGEGEGGPEVRLDMGEWPSGERRPPFVLAADAIVTLHLRCTPCGGPILPNQPPVIVEDGEGREIFLHRTCREVLSGLLGQPEEAGG